HVACGSMRWYAFLIAAGCGRIAFDPRSDALDPSSEATPAWSRSSSRRVPALRDGMAIALAGGMFVRFASSILAVTLLLGCTAGDDPAAASACHVIADTSFESVRELPLGENPSGTVYGHWELSFTRAGAVEWRLHDYTDRGEYSCDGPRIHGRLAPGTVVELD